MIRSDFTAAVFLAVFVSSGLFGQTTGPGFLVDTYASVTDPGELSFDQNGNLYVGRDNSGSGGGFGDPVKIHQIAAGGSSVTEYGTSPIIDPDAVIVDTHGVFGTAGAVLVGGQISNSVGGQIMSIRPDESIVSLFGPTTTFHNPTSFAFAQTGTLLFTNAANAGTSTRGVYASTGPGDPPAALFTSAIRFGGIAVDPLDRIFVSTDDGRIEVHNPDGSLVDNMFLTGVGSLTPLEIGPLGGGEINLFVIDGNGDLLQVAMSAAISILGTGFAPSSFLELGPDRSLYISEFDNDRVLRVSAVGTTPDGDFNDDGLWDCSDINALVNAVAAMSSDLSFDMNGDGQNSAADITEAGVGWLAVGGANNPGQTSGNAFLVGDANLDGNVDGQDFIIWNNHKFSSIAEWCAGDFTADGVVDGPDFIAWNGNKFMSSDYAAAVPEPAAGVCLLAGCLVFGATMRPRKKLEN